MCVLDSLWCPTSPSPALRVVFEQTREQTLTVHLYSGHDCDRSSTHVWKDQKGYTFGGRLVRALDPRAPSLCVSCPWSALCRVSAALVWAVQLKKHCSEHRWNYLACTIEGIKVKRLQGGV